MKTTSRYFKKHVKVFDEKFAWNNRITGAKFIDVFVNHITLSNLLSRTYLFDGKSHNGKLHLALLESKYHNVGPLVIKLLLHGISHFQCQSCVIEEWNSFSSWTGNCHFPNLLLTLSARMRRWAKTTHLTNSSRHAVIYSRIRNSGYKLNENMSIFACNNVL